MKTLITALLVLVLMLILGGCPLMMPFMIGGMLKTGEDKAMDPKIESTMNELIVERVMALAAHRGPYDHILVDRIEISNDIVPADRFKQSLLDVMRSKDGWQILEPRGVSAGSSQGIDTPINESNRSLGVLDVQLYKGGGNLWLASQLADARSNQLFWSEIYSRALPATE